MAEFVAYSPESIISRAMFNFDAQGGIDTILTGTVRVSVSDSFTKADYTAAAGMLSADVYTDAASGNAHWTQAQIDNIDIILQAYKNFVPVDFTMVRNLSGQTPADIGLSSDIDISLISRQDLPFAGDAALSNDLQFLYLGSRGDIVINTAKTEPDPSFSLVWYSGHVLMHEIGHVLGLAHPHVGLVNGHPILSTDYIATATTGFDQLGFVISSGLDMNKEYFSVMSYDDQVTAQGNTFAQTPMILDVIALQTAYGEGRGSSGATDDTIAPGADGLVTSYRTYFDTGGTDTISLVNYAQGAYLHMGATIAGAPQLVGVSMSAADETLMRSGGSPESLRWFYGTFENASGSAGDDHIVGNALANRITGGGGNDVIDGGDGFDIADYRGVRAEYVLSGAVESLSVADTVAGRDGRDQLTHVEALHFADGTLALDIATAAGAPVYALYRVALGRAPDDAGFRYWVAASQVPGDLAQAFAKSLEFSTDVPGQSPQAFVTALYDHAFGRAPDAAGLAYWVGRLQAGLMTPAEALSEFASSAEVAQLVSAANPVGFWLA